ALAPLAAVFLDGGPENRLRAFVLIALVAAGLLWPLGAQLGLGAAAWVALVLGDLATRGFGWPDPADAGRWASELAVLLVALALATYARAQADARVRDALGAARQVAEGLEVRTVSERVVQTQEEERRRIARDLHDSVGQRLTALRLELELARVRGDAPARLPDVAHLCDEALQDLRRVVNDLRPPELDSADLTEILRGYAERFEVRTGIATSFRCQGPVAPPEKVATCLLRVLQEALTNVSRHAGAREVAVIVAATERSLTLEVADDGCGYDPWASSPGAGLRGIRERCAFLGGDMEVESSPGEGTRLRIRLPLAEHGA
ncbi:MAG: sensor histidine kinase, partial [Deltaproteobacteria bacterium]|nr:sensor histidine kinase [Deltaproteobacteria bacterium]